jgi:hypothetical protein
MFFVGYHKGDKNRLYYYGEDEIVANEVYNSMVRGGRIAGLDVGGLVRGETDEVIKDPQHDDVARWVK